MGIPGEINEAEYVSTYDCQVCGQNYGATSKISIANAELKAERLAVFCCGSVLTRSTTLRVQRLNVECA